MEVEYQMQGETLTLYLVGDIDEYSSPLARRQVDKILEEKWQAEKAIFNLAQIRFMDSTGIGFLIGRYKKLKKFGVEMEIESPNESADKILSMSGVYSLIPKSKERSQK